LRNAGGQGLTLPLIIRRFGLCSGSGKDPEETLARRAMLEATLAYLESSRESDMPESKPIYDELIRLQRLRMGLYEKSDGSEGSDSRSPERYERFQALSRETRSLRRAALLNLYNQRQIGDTVFRKLQYELDLVDEQYALSQQG
jgi:hypothetical protein